MGSCNIRAPTASYFAAIGLAYILMEMTFLSRLTLLLGDPVQTAAARGLVDRA